MKKLLLALLVLGFANSPVSAGDQHHETKDCSCLFCLCKNCDCKKTDSNKSHKRLEKLNKDIEKLKCECNSSPTKKVVVKKLQQRVWVEDVSSHGLWYYGYYIAVNEKWEFRYSRREYKGALSNFRSLYSVQYNYDVKTSSRPAVRVVYEPAY